MREKTFISFFISFIFLVFLLSYLCYKADFTITDNDQIRKYQLHKIYDSVNGDTETIIVGDSSGGCAINARLFSELSHQKTLNLALSGSFGLSGTYNFIKYIHVLYPNINNIIIILGLHSWSLPFRYEGFFDTLDKKSSGLNFFLNSNEISENDVVDDIKLKYLEYCTNPKEIDWNIEYLLNSKHEKYREMDLEHDYFLQEEKKYSNGLKKINSNSSLDINLKYHRKKMYKIIDDYCYKYDINCIYVHGPLHEVLYKNSTGKIKEINSFIANTRKIIPVSKGFYFKDSEMGDTDFHVDVSIKDHVTELYFNAVKKHLIY